MTSNLPGGTVTFLFTDIEGSTQLWETHPEAMKAALARHDDLLRSVVEANHGQVIRTTGDGLHAVFASASEAVAAVVTAQRALHAEAWLETGPVRVRMGLHTGEAELRADDYFGTALNRAALAHELESLAFIAIAQSQPQRAAYLLGAAESVREAANSLMAAAERSEYTANVAALRAQMDETSFAAAWAGGRALTMDQAIAYALAPDVQTQSH